MSAILFLHLKGDINYFTTKRTKPIWAKSLSKFTASLQLLIPSLLGTLLFPPFCPLASSSLVFKSKLKFMSLSQSLHEFFGWKQHSFPKLTVLICRCHRVVTVCPLVPCLPTGLEATQKADNPSSFLNLQDVALCGCLN